MTRLLDTHVHLDFLDNPQAEVAAAIADGVGGFVVPGTSVAQWPALMATVAEIPRAYAAPGLHPMHADSWESAHLGPLQDHLESPRAVAVGEVGLDRQADSSRDNQEAVFRQMIRLARDLDKPLIIHERGAVGRLLEILRQEHADRVGGIFHAFSGSLEVACQAIDLGFALGIGGVVTYPEARRLPETVCQVPGEWLVLETDAPDMSPHPIRKQRNRPANLLLVGRRLAELREWSFPDMASRTTANARRVLRLPDISAESDS